MIPKLETTLSNAQQNRDQAWTPQKNNGGNNKQWINNNRTIALEWSAEVTRGFYSFYCQIFALVTYSAVV